MSNTLETIESSETTKLKREVQRVNKENSHLREWLAYKACRSSEITDKEEAYNIVDLMVSDEPEWDALKRDLRFHPSKEVLKDRNNKMLTWLLFYQAKESGNRRGQISKVEEMIETDPPWKVLDEDKLPKSLDGLYRRMVDFMDKLKEEITTLKENTK